MKLKTIVTLFITAVTVISCSSDRTREEKVAAAIQKIEDPFLIVNANTGNLIEKSGAMNGALPFTYEMLFSFFIDESVTGVDYDTDVQVVISNGGSFIPDFYGIFKLKNEASFIEVLETEANAKIEEKDGFKYVIKESDNFAIVWDEEMVIASNIPINLEAMFTGGSGKEGMKAVDRNISIIKASEEGEVNDEFSTFLVNDADVSMHFVGKNLIKLMEQVSPGQEEELEKTTEILNDLSMDMMLNFNKGSISLDVMSQLSEELKEQMNFMADAGAPSQLLSYGNSKDPMLSLTYNVDMEKAVDYMEEQMTDEQWSDIMGGLEEVGLTKNDARTALTGNVVVMLDRIEMKEELIDYGYGEPYLNRQPEPMFGIVLSVKDKSIIERLLAERVALPNEDGQIAAVQVGEVVRSGDAFIVLEDDVLFSTNDSLWAEKVANGTTVQITDHEGTLTENVIGVYGNLSVLGTMPEMDEARPILTLMEDIIIKGQLEESHLVINFKDKSVNALRLLTETISNLNNENMDAALEAELEAAVAVEDAVEEVEEMMEELEE